MVLGRNHTCQRRIEVTELDKYQANDIFNHINRTGILLETEDGTLNYVLNRFVCSIAFNRGMFYISIYHDLDKNAICDNEILNMLNQSVPYGNHTLEDGVRYHFRGFLPFKTDHWYPARMGKQTIKYLMEAKELAEVAAAGGYRLLTQSYLNKNIHYEFQKYREWLSKPASFPRHYFDV